MNVRFRPVLSWVVAAAIGLAAAAPAEAGSIKLSDGISTLVITDQDFVAEPGSPADQSPELGVVIFMGSLGSWTFSLTSGISKPVLGSETEPLMELHDVSLSSSAEGGTITIWFSEVGFGPTGPVVHSVVGGTADGKVTYEAFQGAALFDETTALGSLAFSKGAFGDVVSHDLVSPTGPYSLTEKVTITHKAGSKVSSFDASLSVPPSVPEGGMTLSLLGLGLIGVAGLRRTFSPRG